MKIIFTRDLSFHLEGSRTIVKQGDTLTVSDKEAQRLISRGWATSADGSQPVAEKVERKEKP